MPLPVLRSPATSVPWVLAVLLIAAAPAAASELSPPRLRLDGRARPLSAALDLTIRPGQPTFSGRIEIEVDLAAPHRVLWLHARALEIEAASLEAAGRAFPATVVPGGEQHLGFDFGEAVPAGRAVFRATYRGVLEELESEGLFRQQSGGEWYVFSQFQATAARRAFPGFDEPGYKIPWRVTVRVPRGLTALFNSAAVAEREDGDGLTVVEFAETRPLPSYLLAFGVGPFDFAAGGRWGELASPIRVATPRGRAGEARYAAPVTGELLARLEEYFGVPYPFGKLDDLSIPKTVGFTAMEHPGLITYSETAILAREREQTPQFERRYARICAHENAHQWFGNLVTLAWWDDTWLNEGFATWLEGKIIAEWRPEWGGELGKVEDRVIAIEADSLASARKVRQEIAGEGDIETAFDPISYQKGAALLAMFERWLGEAAFRDGVRRFVEAHAFGNATADDFLAALEPRDAGGGEVAAAFATFLDQPGVPRLSFSVDCGAPGGPVLAIAQERFLPLGAPATAPQLWRVPVHVRYGAAAASRSASPGRGKSGERTATLRLLLDRPRAEARLDFCPGWVQGNDGALGYYVADYEPELLSALTVLSDRLPPVEQLALLEEAEALAHAGRLPMASVLDLARRFAASPVRQVAESALALAGGVRSDLVAAADRTRYARYLEAAFGPRAEELGWTPRAEESDDMALLRPDVLELLLAEGGRQARREEAEALAARWLDDRAVLGPDLVPVALEAAARSGDAAFHQSLLTALAATEDLRERRWILGALGAFRDPGLLRRSLGLLLDPEVDPRESLLVLRAAFEDRVNREPAWTFLTESFDKIAARLPEELAMFLAYAPAGFCDRARHAEAEAFFRPRVERFPGSDRLLAQALETIDQCVAVKGAQAASVAEFLAGY